MNKAHELALAALKEALRCHGHVDNLHAQLLRAIAALKQEASKAEEVAVCWQCNSTNVNTAHVHQCKDCLIQYASKFNSGLKYKWDEPQQPQPAEPIAQPAQDSLAIDSDEFWHLLTNWADVRAEKFSQREELAGDAIIAHINDWQARAQGDAVDAWLPIATAPRDGFFLVHEDGAIRAMFRYDGKWQPTAIALDEYGDPHQTIKARETCVYEPTHWREVPAPPAIAADKERA